jgi:hypothetical protein
MPDPGALAESWLADPDVRAFLAVHDWDGAEWLDAERWPELLELAGELDRAAGARRASPALSRLRAAAETAAYRVDRLRVALGGPSTAAGRKRAAAKTRAKAKAPAKAPTARRRAR